MDRDTVRPVALALLAVVAIGFAAATLNSAVLTDSSGGLGFGEPGSTPGTENGSRPGLEPPNSSAGPGVNNPRGFPCIEALNTWWAIGAIVAALGLLAYVIYRRRGKLGLVVYAGPVLVPVLVAHAFLTSCGSPAVSITQSPGITGQNASKPPGGGGAPGSGAGSSIVDPSILLMAGLGVALLAAVALLFVSSSGDDPEADEEFADVDDDGTDVQAVGRTAGEAADRIEDATDVENEVFRAWREMTDHLDVANPASSTPAEFAGAAVEAGMAREDVDRLTSLFEEVRYGGESATEERERQALDALRRIEREYAGESPDGGRSSDAGSASDAGDESDTDAGGDAE